MAQIAGHETTPVLLLHGFAGTPHMLRPLGRFVRTRLRRRTLQVHAATGWLWGVGHFSLLTSRRVYRVMAGGLGVSGAPGEARALRAAPKPQRGSILQTDLPRAVADAAGVSL